MKRIPEILDDSINRIKPTAAIIGIVDNLDGSYTIQYPTLRSTYISLKNGIVIEISDTINFNGLYEISNLTANSFDITKASGSAVVLPLGSFIQKSPHYYFSKPLEYANKISQENYRENTVDLQQFPGIHLNTFFTYEKIDDLRFTINNIRVALIDYTVLDSNYPQRHTFEMPYLFDLYQKLTKEIRKHENITSAKFSHTEDCFAEIKQNELINLIEMTLNCEIKITNNCEY